MPVSGKNGSATWNGTPIPDVRNISVNDISEPQKYASSSTNGVKYEEPGHEDVAISFGVYTDEPPFDKGDKGALVLLARSGVELFNGDVHISAVNFGVDIEAGGLNNAAVTAGRTII